MHGAVLVGKQLAHYGALSDGLERARLSLRVMGLTVSQGAILVKGACR